MSQRKKVIAIVGRPNVGKSTLFNRLLGTRRAIVQDVPGVTRDRLYADARYDDRDYILIDTGGLLPGAESEMTRGIHTMAEIAVGEADAVIFLMDAREGLSPVDRDIYRYLRKSGKPVYPVANKVDGPKQDNEVFEFYALGVPKVYPVSAQHKIGITDLMDEVMEDFSEEGEGEEAPAQAKRIAIVGRPNVGKSSLLNKILGYERVLVSETPGTTRDPVDTPITVAGRPFILVDTAGIRRKSRILHAVERLSVLKSLTSIDRCDVALLMLDAAEGATDQDAKVAGFIDEKGKGVVILVNKWDLVEKDEKTADTYARDLREDLHHVAYAPIIFTSALTGKNVHRIFSAVRTVLENRERSIGTGELNVFFDEIKHDHSPGVYRGRPVKIYYATQAGTSPPTVILFSNYPQGIKPSYARYITNRMRERFRFEGTPIRLVFKGRNRGR
jgi:GTP-binding protein